MVMPSMSSKIYTPRVRLTIHESPLQLRQEENQCEPRCATTKRQYESAHAFSVLQLLHEARMLLDALDPERLCLGADGKEEVVVWNGGLGKLTFDVRVVCCRRTSE
jgi:hypothetical protein